MLGPFASDDWPLFPAWSMGGRDKARYQDQVNDAAPELDVRNLGNSHNEGLSVPCAEKFEKCVRRPVTAGARRFPASGRAFEKIGRRDLENFPDLLDPAAADPVHAFSYF
jgi:hypothetical protein